MESLDVTQEKRHARRPVRQSLFRLITLHKFMFGICESQGIQRLLDLQKRRFLHLHAPVFNFQDDVTVWVARGERGMLSMYRPSRAWGLVITGRTRGGYGSFNPNCQNFYRTPNFRFSTGSLHQTSFPSLTYLSCPARRHFVNPKYRGGSSSTHKNERALQSMPG